MPAEITREHYEYSLSPFICKQVLLPIPLPGGVVMDGDTAQVAPNKDAIFQHLEALFHPRYELPTGLWFEIVWGEPIDDGALSNTKHFSPLQLNEAAEFAFEKSKAGNNVYVSPGLRTGVAAGKSNRANSTNFARSNWAWAEFDGEGNAERIQAISDEKGLKPDTVVMTGRTPHIRAHLYFRLDKAVTSIDELKAANEGLQTLLGTDPAVKDVVRVLRLAGTVNYPPPKKVKRGYVKERVQLHRPPAPEYTAAHLAGLGGGNAFEAGGEKKPRRTPDDIIALLEKTKTPGHWHNNMLVVTASLVGKGWDDEAIQTACHTYCKDGANDPDLIELIVSARKKFNKSEEEAQRRNEQRAVNVKIGEKPLEPNLPVILTIPEMEDRLVLTSSGAVVDRATVAFGRRRIGLIPTPHQFMSPKEKMTLLNAYLFGLSPKAEKKWTP
jgi:hypothetical protein